MSRCQKITARIIPVLLISTFFLLVSCSQEIALSPNENNQLGTNDTPFSPPAVLGPLSDYEYYKRLEISEKTTEVGYITKYHHGNENKVIHLLQILRDEVVPQSVNALVNRFPNTFNPMKNQEIGMGIGFLDSGSAVAAMYSNTATLDSTHYGLRVRYTDLIWEDDMTLSSISRKEFEAYIVHEMMHGLMSEALTCGYFGAKDSLEEDENKKFPLWFQEGTAEAVCGGARLLRKKLVPEGQLEITSEAIKEFINKNPLTNAISSTDAAYSTGWLAVMYLGHLASGSTDINPRSIANGLDTIMSKIYEGMNLSGAIKVSCARFENITDFQTNFTGDNPEVVIFVMKLMNAIGSNRGSVLVDDFSQDDDDLVPDEAMDSALFWLYINSSNTYTNKIYGDQYPLFEGGFGN